MMQYAFDLVIIALAAGRVSYALAADEIFRPLREIVYRYSAPLHARNTRGEPWAAFWPFRTTSEERTRWPGIGRWDYDYRPEDPRDPGWFGRLVECPLCVSFWVSVAMLAAYSVAPALTVSVATPFAIWAAASWYASRL